MASSSQQAMFRLVDAFSGSPLEAENIYSTVIYCEGCRLSGLLNGMCRCQYCDRWRELQYQTMKLKQITGKSNECWREMLSKKKASEAREKLVSSLRRRIGATKSPKHESCKTYSVKPLFEEPDGRKLDERVRSYITRIKILDQFIRETRVFDERCYDVTDLSDLVSALNIEKEPTSLFDLTLSELRELHAKKLSIVTKIFRRPKTPTPAPAPSNEVQDLAYRLSRAEFHKLGGKYRWVDKDSLQI
ncbi:uncharacterized protein LOC125177750 [Hyalella azteca]|uniref:Uncharacterized protein LOC125177750 n=1 Tax=Hyalella azteca TaxID=294128 RepID=A0A979FH25_HYAAZ|nr:uncharacterized protein LOC125177750 [Hyalella azteca]